jgi:hypothetical protein
MITDVVRKLVAERERIELALSELGYDREGRLPAKWNEEPRQGCIHRWETRRRHGRGGRFYFCLKCKLVIDCDNEGRLL